MPVERSNRLRHRSSLKLSKDKCILGTCTAGISVQEMCRKLLIVVFVCCFYIELGYNFFLAGTQDIRLIKCHMSSPNTTYTNTCCRAFGSDSFISCSKDLGLLLPRFVEQPPASKANALPLQLLQQLCANERERERERERETDVWKMKTIIFTKYIPNL